jgi:hypothetical protein
MLIDNTQACAPAYLDVIRARESERPLSRVNKIHPALRHGGYSATTILPGEDSVAFEKLRRDLIAELLPKGALEHDIVATIARLVWRSQNLATFRLAELARKRRDAIRYEHNATIDKKYRPSRPSPDLMLSYLDPGREVEAAKRREAEEAEREAAVETADRQARQELGDAHELAEIGEPTTIDRLLQDLEVEDRLSAMIDKCLKRLLFLRGLKSLSTASSSAPTQPIPEPQRIPGPTRAA